MIDPAKVRVVDGFNVRDLTTAGAREALDVLKESIRSEGVKVPLKVRQIEGDFYVISGHRRITAVHELLAEGVEVAAVPAYLEARYANDADRIIDIITDNAGEPLTQMEKAKAVRRLLNLGVTSEEIGKRLGYRSPASIHNFELLLSASQEVQTALNEGVIAPTTVVGLVREHGSDEAEKMVREAREKAKARGSKKVTQRDLPRKARQTAAAAEEPPTRRMTDLPQAIEALIALSEGEATIAQHVESWISTLDFDKTQIACDWLMEFTAAFGDTKRSAEERSQAQMEKLFSGAA